MENPTTIDLPEMEARYTTCRAAVKSATGITDPNFVDDVFQESLYRLLKSKKNWKTKSRLCFFFGIARIVALELSRRARRSVQLADIPVKSPEKCVVDVLIEREETKLVDAVLQELSADDRQIIKLRELDEQSTAEVAAQFGKTVNATGMRHKRAMKRLKAGVADRISKMRGNE